MQATPAQISFLSSLALTRKTSYHAFTTLALAAAGAASMHAVSQAIEEAKHAPYATVLPKKEITATPGYYLLGGVVHVVVVGKENGNTYAKKLILSPNASGASTARWDYAKGAIYACVPEARLTVEQAREMGKLHGVCMVCGRTLTDGKSVAQGIGPVCIKKLG